MSMHGFGDLFHRQKDKNEQSKRIAKVYVDQDRCMGCFLCSKLSPGVFALGENGKAQALTDEVNDANRSKVLRALRCCPARAIREAEAK